MTSTSSDLTSLYGERARLWERRNRYYQDNPLPPVDDPSGFEQLTHHEQTRMLQNAERWFASLVAFKEGLLELDEEIVETVKRHRETARTEVARAQAKLERSLTRLSHARSEDVAYLEAEVDLAELDLESAQEALIDTEADLREAKEARKETKKDLKSARKELDRCRTILLGDAY